MYLIIVISELVLLFLLSKQLTQSLSLLLQLLKFNQQLTITVISLIFLPGTIMHELSHWLMAKILLVPTGEMSLFPKLQGTTLRMGSVVVAKVDRLRQLLIGFAPFFIGISALFLLLYFFIPNIHSFNYSIIGLFVYLLFIISNSMFSSKKDTEGAALFIVLFAVFLSIFYILNSKILVQTVTNIVNRIPISYLLLAIRYLAIPLALDISAICVLILCIRILRKV